MLVSAFVLFTVLWCTLVYDPVAHWVWGVGGCLRNMGALDFAGGTVVHINSGFAALATAIVMGRRLGYPSEPILPHNLTLTVLGAGVLWFAWVWVHAGSARACRRRRLLVRMVRVQCGERARVGVAPLVRVHGDAPRRRGGDRDVFAR